MRRAEGEAGSTPWVWCASSDLALGGGDDVGATLWLVSLATCGGCMDAGEELTASYASIHRSAWEDYRSW
jgi:hypothetical protein